MSLDLISGGLVVLTVLFILWQLTRRPAGFPPGPPCLPFFGNLLFIESDFRVMARRLRRKYGDIFSVYIFNTPMIVMNGYNVLREALVKNGDVFSHRPHDFFTDKILDGKGLSGSSGPRWKHIRTFAIVTLRELGMGKASIENNIMEEISTFLAVLEEERGQPIDIRPTLYNTVSNVICSVVFGKRFEYNDPLYRKLLQSLQDYIKHFPASNTLDMIPGLKDIPRDLLKFKSDRAIVSLEEMLLKPSIKEHLEQVNNTTENDFIFAYIREMQHRNQRGEEETFDIDMLVKALDDLFVAGTETTATIISWTIVYFLNYPHVQDKCFQEISENIGLNRPPSMKDKTNLPYVEATIMEVLRYADIVPMALTHTVPMDVQFHGYNIPKGVAVIPMLDSVLQDPDVWGDPYNFRPERFLDDKGKYKKIEELVPFSLGPRTCMGESLARMELFLFLTSMIQRFEFRTTGGVKPSMEGIMGLTYFPKPFKMRAVIRD